MGVGRGDRYPHGCYETPPKKGRTRGMTLQLTTDDRTPITLAHLCPECQGTGVVGPGFPCGECHEKGWILTASGEDLLKFIEAFKPVAKD